MKKQITFSALLTLLSLAISAQNVQMTVQKYEAVIFTTVGGEIRGILAEITDSTLIIYPDFDERAFKKGENQFKLAVPAKDILKVRLRKSSKTGKIVGVVLGGTAGGLIGWGINEMANNTAHAITTLAVPYAKVEKEKNKFNAINLLGIVGGVGVGLVIGSRKRTKKEYFVGGNPDFFKPLRMELQSYIIQLNATTNFE